MPQTNLSGSGGGIFDSKGGLTAMYHSAVRLPCVISVDLWVSKATGEMKIFPAIFLSSSLVFSLPFKVR